MNYDDVNYIKKIILDFLKSGVDITYNNFLLFLHNNCTCKEHISFFESYNFNSVNEKTFKNFFVYYPELFNYVKKLKFEMLIINGYIKLLFINKDIKLVLTFTEDCYMDFFSCDCDEGDTFLYSVRGTLCISNKFDKLYKIHRIFNLLGDINLKG